MNQYTVQFYRDEEGWWVARVTGLRGVHSQGRSIEEARRHVREALSLVVGDTKAKSAKFCEKIHLGGIEGLSWKKNTIITCSSDLNIGIINIQ